VARELSRFCKMARRPKVVGPHWHKSQHCHKCFLQYSTFASSRP